MTGTGQTGVVVDTMVISWFFEDHPGALAEQYRELIAARPVLLAFQTVMELRYGALRANWGDLRCRRLERRIAELTVVQPDDEMVTTCARLRQSCRQVGHALGNKIHDGDRWIASAAIRLGLPLVSNDQIFLGAPGLAVLAAPATS